MTKDQTPPAEAINKLLLIRTDRIGDVILTTPAASRLRDVFPNAHITFMVRDYTAELLALHHDIDEVIRYQPQDGHRGLAGHIRLARQLRADRFDAAILFYPRPLLAAALRLSGIPRRIGTGYKFYSLLFNRRIYEHRMRGGKHELDCNLTLLDALVPHEEWQPRFAFSIPPILDEWRRRFLASHDIRGKYAVIHAGNGGSAPNLTVAQYRALARQLLAQSDLQLLFTGIPPEAARIGEITAGSDGARVIKVVGELDMVQLTAVIAAAALFAGSSTGPLHIARAFDVPLMGFYCPARACAPARWGPYRQQEWTLTSAVTPCERCNSEKCPHGNCLSHLTDETLQAFVARRLAAL